MVTQPIHSDQDRSDLGVQPEASDAGAARELTANLSVAILAVGLTAVGLARLSIIWIADKPRIMADEIGAWSIAHYLRDGHPDISMLNQPPYPVGPGLLLVPVTFAGGPIAQYRAFTVVTALLLVIGAMLLVQQMGKWLGASRIERLLALVVAVALPGVFFGTSFSWAEFIVPLYWSVLVWSILQVRSQHPRRILLASISVGLAPLVHGRFMGAPAVWLIAHAVVIVASFARSREANGSHTTSTRRSFEAVAVTIVVFILARALDEFVVEQVWSNPGVGLRSSWQQGLTDLHFYKTLAVVTLGQVWYAMAASFGLAAVGGFALLSHFRAQRLEVTLLSVVLLSNLATSSVFLAGALSDRRFVGYRPDHLFYGRYIDGGVWVLAVIGVLHLASRRSWNRVWAVSVVASLLAAGLAVDRIVDWISDRVELRPFFGPTAPGVWVLPFEDGAFDIARWTLVSAFAATVITLAASARSRLPLIASIVAVMVLASAMASSEVRATHTKWDYDASYVPVPPPQVGHDRVVVASDVLYVRGFSLIVFAQQFQLTQRGWSYEFSELTSDELLSVTPAGVGVMVVLASAAADDHRVISRIGPAAILTTSGQ